MKKPKTKEQIVRYFHCSKCIDEIPYEESPATWARLNVGFTKQGMQVWCQRHDLNVIHLDFQGQKVAVI